MKGSVMITAVSYAKLQRRYGGKFVARQDSRVLASGATYRQLLRTIRRRHLDRQQLIVGYVPPKGAICIYSNTSFQLSTRRRSATPQVVVDPHRRRMW